MRFHQRLDFKVSVIVVLAMLISFSFASWLYLRHSLIFYAPIEDQQINEITALVSLFNETESISTEQILLSEFQHFSERVNAPTSDYLFVLVNESYDIVAQTAPGNYMIELVRPEASYGYFAVTISAVFEKADIFNIFVAVPGRLLSGWSSSNDSLGQYWLLAIPKANNVTTSVTLSTVARQIGMHLGQFIWLYIGMVILAVFVVLRSVRPLRKLESVAKDLSQNRIPEKVIGEDDSEVGRLIGAFNLASDKLALNQQQKEQMISDVAHELRTPVTNVLGRIEALQEGIINDERDVINFSQQQLTGLANIIDDMQLLSSVDAQKLTIYPTPTKLESLLEKWRRQYLSEQLLIRLETQPGCGLKQVLVDPLRMQQVLDNLLTNSQRAKPGNCEIILSISLKDNALLLDFIDNGPGVDEQHLPLLFERLYRADPSRSEETGGSGLGLSIVKSLLEAQGGHVEAFLPNSGGLGIRISLPIYNPVKS